MMGRRLRSHCCTAIMSPGKDANVTRCVVTQLKPCSSNSNIHRYGTEAVMRSKARGLPQLLSGTASPISSKPVCMGAEVEPGGRLSAGALARVHQQDKGSATTKDGDHHRRRSLSAYVLAVFFALRYTTYSAILTLLPLYASYQCSRPPHHSRQRRQHEPRIILVPDPRPADPVQPPSADPPFPNPQDLDIVAASGRTGGSKTTRP